MDAERARAIGDRWVLPASQLAFFESPSDAARRIAREMLGWREPPLGEPQVFSEAYPRDSGSQDPHWDLHFLFRTVWPGTSLTAARGRLWKELRFVRPVELSSAEFGRGHGDVLALAGLPPRGPPSG